MHVHVAADSQVQSQAHHTRPQPEAFTTGQARCRRTCYRHRAVKLYTNHSRYALLVSSRPGQSSAHPLVAAFQPQDPPIEQVQQLQPPTNGPKFRPFVPQTGVRQELLDYRHQVKVAGGVLHIQPLTQSWVHECGSLLTNAFADAMGYLPVYRTYLRHQIRQYLQRHAEMPPKAIVLIALLVPDPVEFPHQEATSSSEHDSTTEVSTTDHEPGGKGILVGTVELSFATTTRARYLTLNAPPNCAYLANMAVDGNYRRRGYGNILLHAADAVTKIAGEHTIYLHLRFQDAAPARLYKQAGYMSDKEDMFLVKLLGLDRRYLMKKSFKEADLSTML